MAGGKQSASSRARAASLFGLALLAAAFAAAYHSGWKPNLPGLKNDAARPQAAAGQKPAPAPGTLKIDDDDQERGGIEAAVPKEIAHQEHVRAYGVILSLDRLLALYNSAITAAQQLKAAEIKLDTSRAARARALKLLQVFPTAAAPAEAAEAAESIDRTAVEAAKAQLETLRNTAIQDWGPVLGPAVTARSQVVEDLIVRKTCLVRLTLQPDAGIEAPQHATIALGSGASATAELVSPATQADARIAGASYFYTMPVTASALTGASISAALAKGEAKPSVVIPPAAVVWMGGRPWIYIKKSSEIFERKPIDADAHPAPDGGYVLPASRWPKDLPIVVAGAQALLSEETKSQRADEDND